MIIADYCCDITNVWCNQNVFHVANLSAGWCVKYWRTLYLFQGLCPSHLPLDISELVGIFLGFNTIENMCRGHAEQYKLLEVRRRRRKVPLTNWMKQNEIVELTAFIDSWQRATSRESMWLCEICQPPGNAGGCWYTSWCRNHMVNISCTLWSNGCV